MRAGSRSEAVGLIVLFAVVGAYLLAHVLRVDAYALMVDELLYVKAAQGFADNPFTATVFGERYPVPNALYPRLLSIPYGVLGNVNAFDAAHMLNAAVFASTLVPVYLLARRLGATHGWSLVGGALAVVVPWALATAALMAEALAYPVFAWAVLAAVVAIADPRPRNDALLLGAALAMVYARAQFIVVLAAIAAALVAHELAWPAREPGELIRRARSHWLLGGAVAFGLFVAVVIRPDVLGNYATAIDYPRFPGGLLESMADHLAHVVLGVGVIPWLLWSAGVVRGGSTPARREEHAFAYLSALTVLLIVYQSGFYSRQIAGGHLQERYTFYVAALLAAGSALVLARPPRRAPLGSVMAGTAVAGLAVATAHFPTTRRGVEALIAAASKFNAPLTDFAQFIRPSWTVGGALAFATAVAAGLVLAALGAGRLRRFTLPVLAGTALTVCALQTQYVLGKSITEINGGIPVDLSHPPKAWVDGLVYRTDDDVGVFEGAMPAYTSQKWLWLEFWNSRVKRVYAVDGRPPVSRLPETRLVPQPETGRLLTEHELPLMVVSAEEPALSVRGEEVRTIVTGQRLIRPARPYRADWLYGDASTSAIAHEPRALSVYPPAPGAQRARLAFDVVAAENGERQRWEVTTGSRRITGRGNDRIEVDVEVEGSRGVVWIRAPGAGDQPLLSIARVALEWSR